MPLEFEYNIWPRFDQWLVRYLILKLGQSMWSGKKWWRISKKISPSENIATYGPSYRMIFSSGTECGNNSKFLSITILVCLLDFHAELQKVEVPGILNSRTKVNEMLYGLHQAAFEVIFLLDIFYMWFSSNSAF